LPYNAQALDDCRRGYRQAGGGMITAYLWAHVSCVEGRADVRPMDVNAVLVPMARRESTKAYVCCGSRPFVHSDVIDLTNYLESKRLGVQVSEGNWSRCFQLNKSPP